MDFNSLKRASCAALACVISLAAIPARAEISVSFIAPDLWGQPDESIGLAGGVVEDFENVTLAPGLFIEISDAAGNLSGTGSGFLPNLFNPVSGDPFGDAFVLGVWDGTSVLVNTEANQSIYYGSQDWRPVAFYVPAGTAWIALATQQVTVSHTLRVNGQAVGRLIALGFPTGVGRNGVMVVSSDDPAVPIVSVSFGGAGDAFVVDHVVFAPPDALPAADLSWGRLKTLFR